MSESGQEVRSEIASADRLTSPTRSPMRVLILVVAALAIVGASAWATVVLGRDGATDNAAHDSGGASSDVGSGWTVTDFVKATCRDGGYTDPIPMRAFPDAMGESICSAPLATTLKNSMMASIVYARFASEFDAENAVAGLASTFPAFALEQLDDGSYLLVAATGPDAFDVLQPLVDTMGVEIQPAD